MKDYLVFFCFKNTLSTRIMVPVLGVHNPDEAINVACNTQRLEGKAIIVDANNEWALDVWVYEITLGTIVRKPELWAHPAQMFKALPK